MLPNGWAKRSGRSDRLSGPDLGWGWLGSGSKTWVFVEGRAGLAGHWVCTELAAQWTFGLTGAGRVVIPVAVGTTTVPG